MIGKLSLGRAPKAFIGQGLTMPLDANGCQPDAFRDLRVGLLDRMARDIEALFGKYQNVAGCCLVSADISESIGLKKKEPKNMHFVRLGSNLCLRRAIWRRLSGRWARIRSITHNDLWRRRPQTTDFVRVLARNPAMSIEAGANEGLAQVLFS